MLKKAKDRKPGKVKRLFLQLFDKIDKKLEEKAKSQTCCCKPSDKGGNSCCS